MKANRAHDWLLQAEDDLIWAKDSLKSKHFSQTCFICQQVAEKALKAVALSRGFSEIKSHSVTEIAKALEINSEIAKAAGRLDQYYISARYPDALPSGAPFQVFSIEQAEEAISFAKLILKHAATEVLP